MPHFSSISCGSSETSDLDLPSPVGLSWLLQGKTRWKPRTRMYSRSRSWTTSENLCNRKTNLFFHASCAHIVSAKAPDQQLTKRQLTHKDTHGKHRLKTVHISPVTSLQCGVESVECGVWSGKCRVWSVECKVRSVECKVWSGECRVCKV